jgi:hypothetical protein
MTTQPLEKKTLSPNCVAARFLWHLTYCHTVARTATWRARIRSVAMSENDVREEMTTDTHKPARPLKYFKDKDGYGWLCDKEIDPEKNLREQGCWRCDEMAFPTGGR